MANTIIRLFAFYLLLSPVLFAQTQSEIINSGDYFYGSGTSFDVSEARDRALAELTEQIVVRVSKSFVLKIEETSEGLENDVKSILKTHSAATLRSVKT
jgi:hypothetical protein